MTALTAVWGTAAVAAGPWAMASPGCLAALVGLADQVREGVVRFLADAGAFQVGLGAGLLLAPGWGDSPATVLAGFLVATTAHTANHVVDLDEGGAVWQPWLLGAGRVAVAAALHPRVRGTVRRRAGQHRRARSTRPPCPAEDGRAHHLSPRRDAGRTPVSIAVDAEHAYLRSLEKALRTRRLAREGADIAPSDGLGRAVTGPAVRGRMQDPPARRPRRMGRQAVTGPAVWGRMRGLRGAEERHAANVPRSKYPLPRGVLVPGSAPIPRERTGHTIHFEFTPR